MAKLEIQLDPTNHYADQLGAEWEYRVKEALGILPEFLFGPHDSLAQNMQDNYQFFMSWTPAGDAYIEDHCFVFPGDPELPPLLMAEQGDETIYIYPHCIVAVCTEGDLLKWTRMD